MINKFYKVAKIGAAVLGVIGILLLVRVVAAGEAVVIDAATQASTVDPFVSFTFLMLGLTTVSAIGFSLWSLIQNPAALKKALISLAVLGVLFVIAYTIANDGAVTDKFGNIIEKGEVGPISKNSGALIKYTYFLGVIGLACVLWGSVKEMFSNK
jgi:hypothetical protein